MRIWHYIESHHEDFGAGLFILPCVVIAMTVAVLVSLVAQAFH